MIITRFGCEIRITEAITEPEHGQFVACFATRLEDGARRFYRFADLKADDGAREIVAAMGTVPSRSSEDLLDHETRT